MTDPRRLGGVFVGYADSDGSESPPYANSIGGVFVGYVDSDGSESPPCAIFIGIAGALAGGFISSALGFGSVTGFDFRSLAIAIAGALLLLWLYRKFKGK